MFKLCSFHASLALISYVLFFAAGIGSLVSFLMNRSKMLRSLPKFYEVAQDVRYKMNCFYISAGLFLLTVAYTLGLMQSKKVWGSYFNLDFKIISSVFVWLYYLVGLVLVFILNWKKPERSSERMIFLGLVGLLLVCLNLLIGNFFLKGLHHFI